MRALFASLPLVMLLTACSSDKAIIDTSQSLIMESSVLSAGILTSKPTISEQSGQQRAASVLENQQSKPVTVHYRFYWYDDKGLEIQPFETPRTVVVLPNQRLEISSQIGNLMASKVRLYLYL
ncbi:MAG: DUF1425 domain-containing protein [Mixta calida]|uniref:DUF1425 domain-containing protein n=1 Tax=Mixta calida TaxID=665913 RepID=A0ABM6S0M8_9GAMM|nr:DUF1425 domain-containing protein [Mixta calida]MBS6059067.1 YcfL family protein [Pantoea sp.]HCW46584.1 DUF1425 domain-containing protein [Erwiniaceae bacterium]AUY24931.1 DUF1425 domain-containing protein [Mixta calida]KAF0860282.1 membrane protein [Mixta calida B021323]MDU3815061.1 DUF1425 domain-containing protein [Pantoea sp.]